MQRCQNLCWKWNWIRARIEFAREQRSETLFVWLIDDWPVDALVTVARLKVVLGWKQCHNFNSRPLVPYPSPSDSESSSMTLVFHPDPDVRKRRRVAFIEDWGWFTDSVELWQRCNGSCGLEASSIIPCCCLCPTLCCGDGQFHSGTNWSVRILQGVLFPEV